MEVTPVQQISEAYSSLKRFHWALKDGGVGAPAMPPMAFEAIVQVVGDFGVGGQVVMRGSILPNADPMNGAHWFVLHDVFDGSAALFRPGGCEIQEPVCCFSPVVSGSGVEVEVYLMVNTGRQ